jgi:hypothetical protein
VNCDAVVLLAYFAVCVALSAAGEPVVLAEALGFCGGGDGGVSCCDAADDAGLRAELEGLRISDAACAAIVKAFLCAVIKCATILVVLDRDSGPRITHHRFSLFFFLPPFLLFFFYLFIDRYIYHSSFWHLLCMLASNESLDDGCCIYV